MQYPLVQLAWRRLYQHPLLLVPPVMVTVCSDTLHHFLVPLLRPSLIMGIGLACVIMASKWIALVWQVHWIVGTYRARVSVHRGFLLGWFVCLMAGEWCLLLSQFTGRDSLGVPFSTVPTLWHLPLPVMAMVLGCQLLMAWGFPLMMVECAHQATLGMAVLRVVRYVRVCTKPLLWALLMAFLVAFSVMLVTLSLSSLPLLGPTIQRVGFGMVIGSWHLIWIVSYCDHRSLVLRSPV